MVSSVLIWAHFLGSEHEELDGNMGGGGGGGGSEQPLLWGVSFASGVFGSVFLSSEFLGGGTSGAGL